MFSGIIEHQAKILSIENGVFRVENTFGEILTLGQSIAHDGACMTITESRDEYYEFFCMQESLLVTNFSLKKAGDTFNVERCLKIGDRIDGHFVSGHIDIVGKVILTEKQSDDSLVFGVSYESLYNPLVIKKGSITINGVSLTIVNEGNGNLVVSLIPLTQDWTNLGHAKLGDAVNLEFDMLGKYIQRYTQSQKT